MGTEGWTYIKCSILLPFLLILQETHHIINSAGCFPWGLFFSCHLGLHSGLLGFWLPMLQICGPTVWGSRARTPHERCSLIHLMGWLQMQPDPLGDNGSFGASAPPQWSENPWSPLTAGMKNREHECPTCPSEPLLSPRNRIGTKGSDTSYLRITHITLPERKTGLFSPLSCSCVSLTFRPIRGLPYHSENEIWAPKHGQWEPLCLAANFPASLICL